MSLVWFDRHGSRHGTLGEPAEYRSVVLSPSGARVAVVRGNPDSADLWMAEAAKGVFSRLTRGPGRESDPAWSPDERTLAYSKTDVSLGVDEVGLAVVRKDLVTGTDQAVAGAAGMYVDDWTADGRSLICRRDDRSSRFPRQARVRRALFSKPISTKHMFRRMAAGSRTTARNPVSGRSTSPRFPTSRASARSSLPEACNRTGAGMAASCFT